MSSKDFAAIAAILAGDFATATAAEKGKVWCLTLSLADYFAKSNPRFDRSQFYGAVFGTEDHFEARDKIDRHPDFVHIPTSSTYGTGGR